MTETQITAKLVSILRKDYYAMVLSIHGSAYQVSSWPDLYISHWKFRGFIECKGAKTVLEPAQISVMRDLVKRKDRAYVLRFVQTNFYSLSNYDESEVLQEFRFKTYKDAAGILLGVLHGLESH